MTELALGDFHTLKPHYTAQECAFLVNEVNQGGRMAATIFREAMLKSDMPLAFNRVSQAELVPQYVRAEPVHSQISGETTLKDFTEQSYIEVWPDLSTLPKQKGRRIKNKAPLIGENDEYPAVTLDEASTSLRLAKYGFRMPLTMEMIINDQLDILSRYPEALAIFLRLLEDILTAEALIADDGNGIRPSITRLAANAEYQTPVNAPLTAESISAAVNQLANTEVRGVRIGLNNVKIVVPRQLELKAKQQTSIASFEVTDNVGGVTRKYTVNNAAAGIPVVVLDPLTDVNFASSASTTWFVIATQGTTGGRPSLVNAYLREFRTPQTFIESPNALTPAGGLVDYKQGNFLNDSIQFKVRHFHAAKIVYAEGIIASSGTGV